ncbi:MAG: hypothetical protein ACRDIY_13980 [Chloroflexota bacterium]
MPDFRPVLSPGELAKRRAAKATRVDLMPYIEYLQTIEAGYAGDLQLLPGENKPTIKRRVTMAAHRTGKSVKYIRSGENQLIFEVRPEQKS